MRYARRRVGSLARLLSSTAVAVALLGLVPSLGGAALMGNYWTTASGTGVTAVTTSTRTADLYVESDVSNGYWLGGQGYNTTWAEANGTIPNCVGSYSVSTQHSASDPVTGEYEWASSSASGNCDQGGSGWNPEGDYCRNMWSQQGAQNTNPYAPGYVDPNVCPRP